jgi:DNA-binding response OmpR family regulator
MGGRSFALEITYEEKQLTCMRVVPPVLIAEDDANDQRLLKMAFQRAGMQQPVVMVQDGREAIEYLSGDREHHPLPCVLITDLKMPKLDGFELLAWLQTQRQFQSLPVVVLSASGHESDVKRTLGLGAREYLVKPVDFSGLVALVKKLDAAWIAPYCQANEETVPR